MDRAQLISAIYHALLDEREEAYAELGEETVSDTPSWMDGYCAGVDACIDKVRGLLLEVDRCPRALPSAVGGRPASWPACTPMR